MYKEQERKEVRMSNTKRNFQDYSRFDSPRLEAAAVHQEQNDRSRDAFIQEK